MWLSLRLTALHHLRMEVFLSALQEERECRSLTDNAVNSQRAAVKLSQLTRQG